MQSTQLDSAAVLQPLLSDKPSTLPLPRNTPFSEKQRKECKFDGKIESPPDARSPEKRHLLIETEELFVDHHVREHQKKQQSEGLKPKADYLLPLTGAQVSQLPHYRLIGAQKEDDQTEDDQSEDERTNKPVWEEEELLREAAIWRKRFVEDYRLNMAVGQMHEHKDTCFKYVIEGGLRRAKHCRFNVNHFVQKAVECEEDTGVRIRDYVFARTGKEPVLPRRPGEAAPSLAPVDPMTGELLALRPTNELGATVLDAAGKSRRSHRFSLDEI